MSILSQLTDKKITFSQAVTQAEVWFSTILSKAPAAVQQDVAGALSAFKQAASDAVMLADTALGPILSAATLAVEAAASTAMSATIGPAASTALSPAVDAGIAQVANALHAEIDAVAAQARARILNTPTPGAPTAGG